jgi:putative phage-type endonuclease
MTHQEWLLERQKGIGGSDISAILGLNPYKTKLDVYHDKMASKVEDAPNEDMLRGQLLEEFVAQMYGKLAGAEIRKPKRKIFRHRTYDYIRASVDRFYTDASGKDNILECKTSAKKITHDTIYPAWVCQVQWYMMILGKKTSTIVWCCPPGFSIEWMEIPASKDFQKYMLEEAKKFWHDHILAAVPPEPTTAADVARLFPVSKEEAIHADESMMDVLGRYSELSKQEKAIKAEKDQLSDVIRIFMKDYGVLKYQDQTVATYRTVKDSLTVPSKALEEKYPEIYNELKVVRPGSRRLLVTWGD